MKGWEKRAERVGFEPTVVLRLHRFSRPTDSTTLAPLQSSAERQNSRRTATKQLCARCKPNLLETKEAKKQNASQVRGKTLSERRGSNSRPSPWQGDALPAELLSHLHKEQTEINQLPCRIRARLGCKYAKKFVSMQVKIAGPTRLA